MSEQAVQFTSIPAVKAAFKAEGDNWFDKGTMEWWHSKIESDLIGGQFFITSEQREPDTERKFSVRKVVRTKGGSLSIDTIGEFHSHETLEQARAALNEAIKDDECECSEHYRKRGEHTPGCPADDGERMPLDDD